MPQPFRLTSYIRYGDDDITEIVSLRGKHVTTVQLRKRKDIGRPVAATVTAIQTPTRCITNKCHGHVRMHIARLDASGRGKHLLHHGWRYPRRNLLDDRDAHYNRLVVEFKLPFVFAVFVLAFVFLFVFVFVFVLTLEFVALFVLIGAVTPILKLRYIN